jgi:hypothetical protein
MSVASTDRPRGIPGHWVVISMFIVGACATALIFIYWEMHTRPFRPLTEAIGREFRHSLPKVEGGRHKQSPLTLRIAMRVPFKPVKGVEETDTVVQRIIDLAKTHADVNKYEVLEVYLIQRVPEAEAITESFKFPTQELLSK